MGRFFLELGLRILKIFQVAGKAQTRLGTLAKFPIRLWAWIFSLNFISRKLRHVLKGCKGGRQQQKADLRLSFRRRSSLGYREVRVSEMLTSTSAIVELEHLGWQRLA